MPTTSDLRPPRADDRIVTVLSEWLAFRPSPDGLRLRLLEIGKEGLSGEQAAAVDELLAELGEPQAPRRGDLEMLVRETLDAVALG